MSAESRRRKRSIARRDFLNGTALGAAGLLTASPLNTFGLEGFAPEQAADYYPPALTGLRGSHEGSYATAHAVKDGGFFASAKADPTIFSPTGEKAVTKIDLNARTKAETENWTLMLVNKSDETVRTFGGKGAPPAHLLWDGKDETGLPLPDGDYRYTLTVRDLEGRVIDSRTRVVQISTGGPQGAVPVLPVE
jgi:hypothetical protein